MESSSVTARVELLLRIGALFIGAVYGSGFVVVSLYHSRFGVVHYGLLRARLLSAGLLLALFFGIGIFLGSRVFGLFGFDDGLSGVKNATTGQEIPFYYLRAVRGLELFMYSVVVAFFSTVFFDHPLGVWNAGEFYLGSAVVVAFLSLVIERHFRKKPGRCALLALLGILGGLVLLFRWAESNFMIRTLWFFYIGILAVHIHSPFRDRAQAREANWHMWIFNAIAMISIFATLIYPKMTPALGGGSPVPSVVEVFDEGLGSKILRVFLIDETDEGFYVVWSRDSKAATFLPRARVTAVHFGSEEELAKIKPSEPSQSKQGVPNTSAGPTAPNGQGTIPLLGKQPSRPGTPKR